MAKQWIYSTNQTIYKTGVPLHFLIEPMTFAYHFSTESTRKKMKAFHAPVLANVSLGTAVSVTASLHSVNCANMGEECLSVSS